jgi:23S rRNA pseudouridine955/2504/2580 synthase
MNGLGQRVRKVRDSAPASAETGVAAATSTVATAPAADRVAQLAIGEEDAGQRLDNFLFRHAKGVPKSHVYRIVRSGEVRINGKRADVSQRLEAGDVVRVPPLRTAARAPTPDIKREKQVAFTIVHEDEALLVVDKPAGVAVHGGSGISFGVIEQLRASRPEARFLELAHRLDRDTSGLLMIAKKRSALVKLHEDLRDGRVRKHYFALVSGVWREQRREVKVALVKFHLPDGERRVRVAKPVDDDALAAHTVFHRVECFGSDNGPNGPEDHGHDADRSGADGAFALLDVELRTGRTHQIRVHLAHLGRPIVGDDKYGDYVVNHRAARASSDGRPALKRMFLHAASLSLTHPVSGEPLSLKAPLPAECAAFVAGLRRAMPGPKR